MIKLYIIFFVTFIIFNVTIFKSCDIYQKEKQHLMLDVVNFEKTGCEKSQLR
jgi:hypothetical protein